MGSKYVVALHAVFFCMSLAVANSVDFSYPAAFNFGDSTSDTGGRVAAFGLPLPPHLTDRITSKLRLGDSVIWPSHT
ncbi:putative alpha-L-fucosidase [Medicago truncatula]|uniref:Putative alpha-L-fucosidase n=1 Tax=Medicago truncatula TaxID=3880 RepID=A0A396JR37_MEDTR|nr:putative alpha-L-fucosidase [Medicago truncatula]